MRFLLVLLSLVVAMAGAFSPPNPSRYSRATGTSPSSITRINDQQLVATTFSPTRHSMVVNSDSEFLFKRSAISFLAGSIISVSVLLAPDVTSAAGNPNKQSPQDPPIDPAIVGALRVAKTNSAGLVSTPSTPSVYSKKIKADTTKPVAPVVKKGDGPLSNEQKAYLLSKSNLETASTQVNKAQLDLGTASSAYAKAESNSRIAEGTVTSAKSKYLNANDKLSQMRAKGVSDTNSIIAQQSAVAEAKEALRKAEKTLTDSKTTLKTTSADLAKVKSSYEKAQDTKKRAQKSFQETEGKYKDYLKKTAEQEKKLKEARRKAMEKAAKESKEAAVKKSQQDSKMKKEQEARAKKEQKEREERARKEAQQKEERIKALQKTIKDLESQKLKAESIKKDSSKALNEKQIQLEAELRQIKALSK